ncbi:MAG: hypothetical protein VX467_05430 [Verrucomicrobiota bacterium]|nr:hypothetical protein [Verrucomicrobiota bacterium]
MLFFTQSIWGQQKSNDFTRRVGSFDGKLNRYSGKSFMNAKLNSKLNNRIRIEEWPTKYSPFGGKRFTSKNHEALIKKRIEWEKVPTELPLQEKMSKVENQRVHENDLSNSTSATTAVEFRDAVYAQLDKRVEDWLGKVNNVSLQEINRYQFRKGRPSEPGFPVQQAGSEGSSSRQSTTQPSKPNKSSSAQEPNGSSYWLGPRKMSVQGGSQAIPRATSQPAPSRGYRSGPRPILGPKKVRVQIGTSP